MAQLKQMKTFAVTRPVGEGLDTAELVREIGWEPFIIHTVELKPYDRNTLTRMLHAVFSKAPVDWLVLMSRSGVFLLFDVLRSSGFQIPRSTRMVAVGPKTLEALHAHGIKGAIMPDNHSSTGVAELLAKESLQGKKIVLARSSEADNVLAERLEAHGGQVETVKLYRSSIPSDPKSALEFLGGLREEGRFQAVLFTSAATVGNLFRIASAIMPRQELASRLSSLIVGAIGPVTAQKLIALGVKPIVPAKYTISEAVRIITQTYDEMDAPRILH